MKKFDKSMNTPRKGIRTNEVWCCRAEGLLLEFTLGESSALFVLAAHTYLFYLIYSFNA